MADGQYRKRKKHRALKKRGAGWGKSLGAIAALVLFTLLAFCYQDVNRVLRQWIRGPSAISSNPSQDTYSAGIAVTDPEAFPEYAGELCVELNGNVPSFTLYDCDHMEGEHYSDLDYLGRCGAAWARLDNSMMPEEEREEIDSVHPSGWRQERYPGIVPFDPPFLYQRCHLIAYSLTGQNANEKNLITGTYNLNIEGMRPYEVQTARYLDESDGHVLYRVTPYFRGAELVPRGVEMEAWSVEDEGLGLCFHVFIYNVQPGIEISYLTGDSMAQ